MYKDFFFCIPVINLNIRHSPKSIVFVLQRLVIYMNVEKLSSNNRTLSPISLGPCTASIYKHKGTQKNPNALWLIDGYS